MSFMQMCRNWQGFCHSSSNMLDGAVLLWWLLLTLTKMRRWFSLVSKLKNHPALMRRLELALVNLCLIEFLIHVENEKLSSKKGKSLMSHTKANLQWCSTVQMSFRTKFFCFFFFPCAFQTSKVSVSQSAAAQLKNALLLHYLNSLKSLFFLVKCNQSKK